ncbi:MAG TPA: hypothetical protein IAB38_02025 [Candidatus Onthousia excrementipullorum]|uniref:Uncharacterized protein n=1 Tax=Candidatus Onthousia excrementipullorum TaxID=2840884 RepID=A0A9D1DTZ0_9FIRM|nr:hypothetical protein [Candidatus Onthousia excrementipullorum]
MDKQKRCIDIYGEPLKIGDEVIPVLEEALIIGISGTISKIEYSEKYNNHYITITDKQGNVLLESVDARCYTTKERFNERENEDFIYSINFYNKRLMLQTSLPLSNITSVDYEIPEDTTFATINARHTFENDAYSIDDVYSLIIDNKVKVCHDKEDDYYYLMNEETYDYHDISSNYRIFKNEEEFKVFVKEIIKYFNNTDLTHINTQEIFDENEKAKVFEKSLINRLSN